MSYYEDNLSKWYISANNKHSTFVNQLKDDGLRNQVATVIDTKKFDSTFDTRFNYEVEYLDDDEQVIGTGNEKFSVWIDEDPNKNKLYRLVPPSNIQGTTPSTTGSDKPKTSSSNSSGFSNNNKFTGERGWFDSKSHDLVTLEDYKEISSKDYTIRPLTAKEKTPNNYMISEKGKKVVYLWVGRWMRPQN
jgi:hypothetical protein